jgi:hypothetical protein
MKRTKEERRASKTKLQLDVVVFTYNPTTQEVGQNDLEFKVSRSKSSETLSQNQKHNNNKGVGAWLKW